MKITTTAVLSGVLAAIGAVTLMATPACSGGGGCGSTSKCSADPAPTQATTDQCNKFSAAPNCGSKYSAVVSCSASNQKCTANNTTDVNATLAACSTQLADYTACCQTNPTDCQ